MSPGSEGRATARRLLLIDHDDTAVMSTPSIHWPAHVEAMRVLRPGREPIDLAGWFARNHDPGLMEYLSGELGLTEAERETAYRIWRDRVRESRAEFFPGMAETLAEHARRGGRLVVVSHSEVEIILRDYRAAGLEPDLVFGWDDDPARRKPAPWPALEALRLLGIEAADALMLDDLSTGLGMAEAAGIDCAAAGWGHDVPAIQAAMRDRCRWTFPTVGAFRDWLLGPA